MIPFQNTDKNQPQTWPALRPELRLYPGPNDINGQPTWTLQDPVRGRFYRINFLFFEVIRALEITSGPESFQAHIKQNSAAILNEKDLQAVFRFLNENQLTSGPKNPPDPHIKRPFWERMLHGYLFFKIPLFRPDAFIGKTLPYIRILGSKAIFLFIALCFLIGLFMTLSGSGDFMNQLRHSFSLEGLVFYAIAIILLKTIHELSHAYTAKAMGARVKTIGIAFILFFPILFTEVTDSWKIRDRYKRARIGLAGIQAELYVASLSLMAWHLTAPGPLKSVWLSLATISMLGSLMINLNPLMRFDGYYVLSDFTGIENLQIRAFAYARHMLRRIILRVDEPPPEYVSRRIHILMLSYAYATMIYRFFLFTGIALLVYHKVFQPLGTILMVVELYYFIAMPVIKELKTWPGHARNAGKNPALFRSYAIGAVFLFIFFIPWSSRIVAPAVLVPADERLYTPSRPAQISKVTAQTGMAADKETVLIVFESPELETEIALTKAELDKINLQLKQSQRDISLSPDIPVFRREKVRLETKLSGLVKEKEQLTIKADFDGYIVYTMPDLQPGLWVSPGVPVLKLATRQATIAKAYIHEKNFDRLSEGNHARFYAQDGMIPPLPLEIKHIENITVPALDEPLLASLYGGPLQTMQTGNPNTVRGDMKLAYPHFRVDLQAAQPILFPAQTSRLQGYVNIRGERRSLFLRGIQYIGAVLRRELNL